MIHEILSIQQVPQIEQDTVSALHQCPYIRAHHSEAYTSLPLSADVFARWPPAGVLPQSVDNQQCSCKGDLLPLPPERHIRFHH